MHENPFQSLTTFTTGSGRPGRLHSLRELEKRGVGKVSRLPVSIRIVLESLLRNLDGKTVEEDDVVALARWEPQGKRVEEVPFIVARIVLQDFTGVPLLVDLAAMRSAVARVGKNPEIIEPLVPVDLVVDHSVQVDYWSTPDAYRMNLAMEFERNEARYQFLKWGMQAFQGFKVVPPGIGIVHQVNLEYLAKGVLEKDGIWYPDTLVGTDSHTTMINGLGIVGWGVGGIEAEAGMLGQPVYFLTPDVVGVHMKGSLREGVTATDLVLHTTQVLRAAKVVGKFVEFFGEGAASLALPDRATIGNMAPEYGATMGFFPADEAATRYLLQTGRSEEHVKTFRSYLEAQGLFGVPRQGECDYSQTIELDLGDVGPSLAGPRRPQDRIDIDELKVKFREGLTRSSAENGYGKSQDSIGKRFPVRLGSPVPADAISGGGKQEMAPVITGRTRNTNPWTETEMVNNRPTPDVVDPSRGPLPADMTSVGHGDVLIAAITSCTNTSNPALMLGAGILAKKAVEKGLGVLPRVKASLAPGSRVVTDYFDKTGLQPYLDRLGFHLVGYGCTTCIGNSGPLDPAIDRALGENDIIAASVLSGNRNFEARIQQSIKANYLMSPPLVVAYALAGTVDIDLTKEPLGKGKDGSDVYLKDIWPKPDEVRAALEKASSPEVYRKLYSDLGSTNPLWSKVPAPSGKVYEWDASSTYIQEPPFFEDFTLEPNRSAVSDLHGARALAIFGDSVTTDHISPAGAIKPQSPAGRWLIERGVEPKDFNSYGSRRGNDRVMTRGTFANVRIKNLMLRGVEGGETIHQPSGKRTSIFDAAMEYQKEKVPLLVFAGEEYGTGSSRDWAAKGTRLLGVRAVVAKSYERIHRSNLVGMGILPCQFPEGVDARSLALDGTESFDLVGIAGGLRPAAGLTLVIRRASGAEEKVPVRARIDTAVEVDYYLHGGILPYVLRLLLKG
jgi:aconitate hydratase